MCEFCGNINCKLTKQQVIERGPILEINAYSQMRDPDEDGNPATYSFKDVPCFNSLSALIPDEDTGCDGDWESWDIQNPLAFQTEKEFLARSERK